MCLIDACEPWHFFKADIAKARKAHWCGECRRQIESGEIYERARGLADGFWSTFKTCRHCIAAREWLTLVCNGFCYEFVAEELGEHIEEGYRSVWLARAAYGVSNGWNRRDGTQLPPPRKPNPACLMPIAGLAG